ncbi:uncharacterized protein TNCV_203431 [Trichonephila clavipes]|nr:uncharacterized protein TNCV_203431 [Trichonephila clavipes]
MADSEHIPTIEATLEPPSVAQQIGVRNGTSKESSLWLEHRTPDRKAWVRCPMPPNTLGVHTEYVLVKSVGPKSLLWAESRAQGTREYFPPFQFHAEIVEVEIGGVAIYHPCVEFRRAESYCHLTILDRVLGARAAGVHYRLFSVWTLVPVRLDEQLSDHSTVDEIASRAADCRLTYTMANCPQRR